MTVLRQALGATVRNGVWVKLPQPESVEIMALAGFDLVAVDLEHAATSMQRISELLATARGLGVASLVRVPTAGREWIQRCLDAGADGVVIPQVDSAQAAAAAVRAARFPPIGQRGVSPSTRAGCWGLAPLRDYLQVGNQAAVVVQVESVAGVANIDAILGAGIDAVLIGPADLATDLGVDARSPTLAEAQTRVLHATQRFGIPCGIAVGDAPTARTHLAAGFDFAVVGTDVTLLAYAARDAVRTVRSPDTGSTPATD